MVFLTETGRFKTYFVNIEYYFDVFVSYRYICGRLTVQPMKTTSQFLTVRRLLLSLVAGATIMSVFIFNVSGQTPLLYLYYPSTKTWLYYSIESNPEEFKAVEDINIE